MDRATELFEGTHEVRVVYSYDVPVTMRGAHGIESVGLHELTVNEEAMATKRAGGDPVRLAFELTKQSLAEINGQPVSLADATADRAWKTMPAKLRNSIVTEFTKLHTPTDEEMSAFTGSMKIKT